MKKAFALILCLVLLLAIPVGCKKKANEKPVPLTESTISVDLIRHNGQYSYPHCGNFDKITDLTILEKEEKDTTATVWFSAKANSSCTVVDLAGKMKYTYKNGHWNMDSLDLSKATPTPTNGPDLKSAMMEINNCVSIIGKAFALQGETEHALPALNMQSGSWQIQAEKGAKTAQLTVNYKSNVMTFTGYYNLTFEETGWRFETIKKDTTNYPVLHLDSLEMHETDKK